MGLRNRVVQRAVLIPDQHPDSLVDVLTIVRRVDPADRALTDPSVPQLHHAATRAGLDKSNSELAHTLAAAGVSIAPNDATLLDLQEQADLEVARLANIRKQAELEHHLAAINPGSSEFLDKVLANREDVAALAAIAPESAVVKRIESSLDAVVALRVTQRPAAEDVARSLLLDLGDLMPESAVSMQRDLIAKFAAASQAKSFDTLERPRRAVLSRRLDKAGSTGAQDLYAQPQRSGASSVLVADARDFLAYGYLKDARKVRFAGDKARAATRLDVSTKLQPNATVQKMLTAEQQELEAGSAGNAAAAAAKLDSGRNQFAQALRSPALGTGELAARWLAYAHGPASGAAGSAIDCRRARRTAARRR